MSHPYFLDDVDVNRVTEALSIVRRQMTDSNRPCDGAMFGETLRRIVERAESYRVVLKNTI